jgi:hypothetical protein
MAAGLRIERIESHTIVDEWPGVRLEAACALRLPESLPEIGPGDLNVRVCLDDPAAFLMDERLGGGFLLRLST